MAIGQGEGEGKVTEALKQALHHPLLDTVSLENAAGVIANFTGGSDLSLFEVQTALDSLQKQTGPQAEIVLGVITDDRMDGRVQAILMITGLGAPTLEQAFAEVKKIEQPLEQAEELPFTHLPDLAIPSTNYDLPAFLRYRTH
jgi:cell division protein FtsZ